MIKHLSLKSRLLLIATVPIVVMLILAILGAWQKHAEYQARLRAETLVNLAIDFTSVRRFCHRSS